MMLQRITDRSAKSTNIYFDEVNKIPMLTIEEEVVYAELAYEGDKEAQEILVKSNLRFVISVAKQFQNRGVKLGDLIDEGNIGLIEASSKFDPSRGFKFISYAVHYIRRGMITALKDCESPCTIPHSRVDRMNKLRKVITNLENQLEREVVINDLYGTEGYLDWEIDELYDLLNKKSTSMNQEIGDTDFMLSEILPSNSYHEMNQEIENDYMSNLICRLACKLPEKHKFVISHMYGVDGYELLNQVEIGNRLGVSRQRIDQIHQSAVRGMKSMYRDILRNNKL